MRRRVLRNILLVAGAALLIAGCQAEPSARRSAAEAEQQRLQNARNEARREMGELRFVVDKSDRELLVYRDGRPVIRQAVSVGRQGYDTPEGSWTLDRVDINPEWNPPDSEWARGEPRRPAGHPENPMGQARLVFNMPYTVHGTDDLQSLGEAASHGSIRVANQHVIALAELLLRAGGAWEGREWFDAMITNRNTEFQIELAHGVPIELRD